MLFIGLDNSQNQLFSLLLFFNFFIFLVKLHEVHMGHLP